MSRYRNPALLAVLLAAAVPAVAQVYDSRMDNRATPAQSSFGPPPPATYETTIAAPAEPLASPLPDAIHSGAANPSDEALADTVAAALAADRRMDGATVTVAANDGRVSLTGSARTPEQAGHAENIARGVAGVGAVSGTLASQGN